MIFTIRTTVGQEKVIMDLLYNKIKQNELEVYSLVEMADLKGYLLVEADSKKTAELLIHNVPHIKGGKIVEGTIEIKEIAGVLESRPLMTAIKPGQTVEIILGPFKGSRAKVIRVNLAKEEVVIELFDATVKIPITIKAENIKVLS
ncbi:MAG: transcription elongation factor Spt5 [archaeon]|jgi:transcriptional antiterminator NusG|nr:transcription elongation factor Spt5 [archaeon]MDD2477882.1 transcription elongation factor Spt5 [Candidatus ainarchaeum sp.]MDD3084423.1 transcription elongation factor Spt5 [Candidatus ainarchaeum sp.]MDD4220885.1 transcription elongation factor Spt5 [Candidatus ainarchaeum sp.]MDD4662686.1 transcription elongation factor Spt5 [Candidatus ainarchaeum sp.]